MQFGIPWPQAEFLSLAKAAKHPFDAPPYISDDVARAVFSIVTNGLNAFKESLEAELLSLCGYRDSLELQEAALHKAMPAAVSAVLKGKNILAWQVALRKTNHGDSNLIRDFAAGFRLTGDQPRTGVFEAKPAEDVAEGEDVRWLWDQSDMVRRELVRSIRAEEQRIDTDVADAMEQATLNEVAKGWASGPFSEQEMTAQLGPRWVASRRFGVKQGDKIRPVDDFSASFVNSCTTIRERVSVDGVDGLVNIVKLWARLLRSDEVEVALRSGEVLRGRRHADWQDGCRLLGKCYDFEGAYKQCAVSPSDAAVAAFAFARRGQPVRPAFFRAHALPFGAAASVLHFNRAAAGLRTCFVRLLGVGMENYFDDFPIVVPAPLAEVVDDAIKRFCAIVGWRLKGGDKDKPFREEFDVLGVVCDLRRTVHGAVLTVANTAKRVESVGEQIDDILAAGFVRPAVAAQLAGRLQFASGQTMGRAGASMLWHLRRAASATGARVALDEAARVTLAWWSEAMRSARPREVAMDDAGPPVLIFTDGFCDPEHDPPVAGFGALLYDPLDDVTECFGAYLPPTMARDLVEEVGGRQLVGQAELIPAIAAREAWGSRLKKRRVINFVDNDAARHGLVRGYSPSSASCWLLGEFWRRELILEASSWFARVASESNVADGPSRLRFDETGSAAVRARRIEPPSFLGALWSGRRKSGDQNGATAETCDSSPF